jgi:hypothetical protein
MTEVKLAFISLWLLIKQLINVRYGSALGVWKPTHVADEYFQFNYSLKQLIHAKNCLR